MGNDVDLFLDQWPYNIERSLWGLIESFRGDLDSTDTAIAVSAANEIEEALSWLLTLESAEKHQAYEAKERAATEEKLLLAGFAPKEAALIAAERANPKRPGGRPKVNGVFAIRAFTQHLKMDMNWRQITKELKGPCAHICPECNDAKRQHHRAHTGPRPRKLPARCPKCDLTIRPVGQRQKVCSKCADAMRDAVGQLEAYLRKKDLYPSVPRRADLKQVTVDGLEVALRRADPE